MKKLLFILLILALPSFSFAAPEMTIVPGPDATPNSWLANDLFHKLAHACNIPNSTCGPDNLVTNAFGARIVLFVPTSQVYTIYWIFTDTEGNALGVFPFNFALTGGTTQNFVLNGVVLPTSSSVATRGLYKFLSLVVGADGVAAFSDYYRVRVLP